MEGKLKRSFKKLLFISLYISSVICAYSQGFDYLLPETFEIRREYRNIITGTNNEIEQQKPVISDSYITGKKVKFQVVSSEGSYYFIFTNEKKTGSQSEFPLVGAGSYVIKRNISSGIIEQIKIFLNNDAETFVRITETGRDCRLEFSLFGSMVFKDVVLPVKVSELVTEPFETIIAHSDYIVNWDVLETVYNESENSKIIKMSQAIDEKLPLLRNADDGAQQWDGTFVLIQSMDSNPVSGFNCSGFAKWVADGIFSAKADRLMDIESLKRKNFRERRDTLSLLYEDVRDPLFGLDWTRNIAMTLYELEHGGAAADISDVDVRDYPYGRYVTDIGYPVSDLKALLYYLAATDPGYIYLGSVNGDFGTSPVLRQYYHIAVFLPYIDSSGNFHPLLYETNVKTGINSFIGKYNTEFIHLVRIRAEDNFKLPVIPAQSGAGQ